MKFLIGYLIGLAIGYFCGMFLEWRRWKNGLYSEMKLRLEDSNDPTDS